jgi:hypothetical protein
MRTGRHSTVTSAERAELWRRYKAGETVLGIGRALGQRTSNLYRVLQATGGIAPPQRTRSPRVLSFSECEEISRGIAAGDTLRAIARSLHRAISTVSQGSGSARGPWGLSGRSSRLGSLGVGASSKGLSAQQEPAVATDRCG